MIHYTIKKLKEMSDEDLMIRIINEKQLKLNPYGPLSQRLDKLEKTIRENARIRATLYEALQLAYVNLGATAVTEHTFTYVRDKMQKALAKVRGEVTP